MKKKKYYSKMSRNYGNFKKIRWDRLLPVSLIIIIILSIIIAFNFDRIQLAFKGYSIKQQSEILELTSDKISKVKSYDKLEHILDWLENSKNVSYYSYYEKYYQMFPKLKVKDVIKMVDEIFNNYEKDLKAVGYSNKQLWTILKNADIEDLAYLVKHKYSYESIKPYMNVSGFSYKLLDQYMDVYKKVNNYNYAVLSVSYPFIISSNKSEDSKYIIKNPRNISNLIKKGFYLPSSYQPKDLVTPDKKYLSDTNDHPKLRKVTYEAFLKMEKAAKKDKMYLLLNSGYRSYKEQNEIYSDYVKKYGVSYASTLAALPGASEHQSGLGVDITSVSVNNKTLPAFGYAKESTWLKNNCYKYGFVIRYQKDKTDITGITNEPWHVRYVGKKIAKIMHEKNWSLEEYVLYTDTMPQIKE